MASAFRDANRPSAAPSGLVWPGVSALFAQSPSSSNRDDSKGKTPGGSPRGENFSFDWSRGRTGSSKRDPATPFLSAWGGGFSDGLPMPSRQRWKQFIALLLLSGLMFVLAGAFLPLVLLRPQKFCLFFSLGSILSMASFAVLRGPIEQLKHMFSLQRLPFTSTYICSLVLTLYAAFVLQSYVLVLLFMAVQAAALGWYLLSYIPGGAPVLKIVTRATLRVLSAMCCRSSSSGWGNSISGSYSLLPM